ncbi:MAG: DUF6125 family protein [Bacteroidales bacterium]|nr:DUF6125 family protein [Bacteroidales bacterium]
MENLERLTKKELIELIDIYAKNQLALDGVWFQSIEAKHGMDEAMEHDRNVWRKHTEIEARRIKSFLNLPDNAGLKGLKKALSFRFNAMLNRTEAIIEGNTMRYYVRNCRVQTARARKGMPFHPCKSVGILEYAYFAKIIDHRIECETISCYPDVTDPGCACAWKFTLKENPED